MQRKTIFLSLALILPVIIFIFLKMFGRNHFDIPVYHTKEVRSIAGCKNHYPSPYLIPDTVLKSMGWKKSQATIVIFSSIPSEGVARIQEEFEPNLLQIVNQKDMSDSIKSKFSNCVFLIPVHYNTVLIDQQRQVRGYYQISNREETDRLMIEISILLNDY